MKHRVARPDGEDGTRLPTPPVLQVVGAVRRQGFLDAVGGFWRSNGDTFRLSLGPRSLVLAMHPDAVRDVNVTHRRSFDKLDSYDGVRRYLTGDGLVTSTGELWRRQRKTLAPFFTPKAVTEFVDPIVADTTALFPRWDALAEQGSSVDMGEEMMRLTASIIVSTMFSSAAEDVISTLAGDVATMISFTTHHPVIRPPIWWPTPAVRTYRAARERVHGSIRAVIARRRALPEHQWPQDLLSRMLTARDPQTGRPMPERLLLDESITMFFAGHETTARTMTAAWFALATNPDVARRFHEELDEVLGDAEPGLDDLRRLPVTLAVAKEVLRLYPAAPFYVRDAVEDTTVAGHAVPRGSTVMLSPYYTHRHPDFWEHPEAFDVDRWTPEQEKTRHPGAYHPFAAGERVCIGNNFSLLETHLLLALLGRRYAPRLAEGYTPTWVMDGVLSPRDGMPMVIRRRPGPATNRGAA